MATVTSRANLSQGTQTAVTDAVFTTGVGADIGIDSAGSELPALAAGEFFEVRDHSASQNNGLYQVVTVNTSTSSYEADKVTGAAPITASSEAITTLGATGASTEKSIHYDVANLDIYVLEQGNVSADGVSGQAIYSFTMQEWKDDNFLIGNAKFPMLCIDSDAGKYIIGQNAAGINTGWNWKDDAAFSIRTRKLLRNMGWDELDANGITIAREVGVLTVDAVEDPVNDTGFYQFGTDTTVDDTVDFTFNGAINEAVRFYEEQAQPGSLAITTTTITRTGGSFITEGYKVGGQVTIRNAEDAGNNGTWGPLTAVTATVLTVASGLTANAADTTAILAVNNANAFKIGMRVRDADPTGKTFAQSNLTTIQKTALSNFIYQFPLATVSDDNITATDATIDGSSPYTGMTLTLHATPQVRTGLVGGSFNFGIIGDANGGTHIQFYEWLQRQLRKLTDIDADADTAIGRTIDLLASFQAGFLQVGSGDGGLSFPTNPDGGGSGMFVDNLAGTSDNSVKFWDNTGTLRSKPETVAVTIDANQTAIDDTAYEYDLFYDRTIRTTVADLVLTAATSKITSATTALPQNSQIIVGKYVRLDGMTTASMDGIYQITVITTPGADWTVVRYDGAALIDSTTASVTVDQNAVDSPDKIIVWTNKKNIESGSTITYTAPDTISDSASGFSQFSSGDIIEIVGSTSNDGIYEVDTAAAGTLTLIEQTITTEASSSASEIYKLFSGLVDADIVESYDFDGNDQGGRTVSTTTYIQARGVGLLTGQYAESTVQTIASGTPVTVPLTAQIERNVA
jgi:hypothetical protein